MSREVMQQALEALITAEAGLADIGDADREPTDDLAWCEERAAQALAIPRQAIISLREALAQPEPWAPEDMTYRPGGIPQDVPQIPQEHSSNKQFTPDWNTEAVLVEEMQRMAKQIAEMQDWEAVAADQAMTIALLRSEQEPVAYMYPADLKKFETSECFADAFSISVGSPTLGVTVPLYTSPPQRELESTTDMMLELADRLGELPDDVDPRAWSHLLVYAPQRQPLTDDEIDELSRTMVKGNKSVNWLCQAIEAAHGIKEKNT